MPFSDVVTSTLASKLFLKAFGSPVRIWTTSYSFGRDFKKSFFLIFGFNLSLINFFVVLDISPHPLWVCFKLGFSIVSIVFCGHTFVKIEKAEILKLALKSGVKK